MMNALEVKNNINLLASRKQHFLFGINFELTEGFVIENPKSQQEILFRTPLASNSELYQADYKNKEILIKYPESFDIYNKRFDIIKSGLMRGDSFLTNLTVKTPIETSLSLKDIFNYSRAPYCIYYPYYPQHFVCFSPERFIKINNGIIYTNPMKGTIDAQIPSAESLILNDEKECREHNTVVDLLRNDLGIVANNICIKRLKYIDNICTNNCNILQVSSEITGELPKDYLNKLGDIIFKMLPAGSISGAPKQSTINLIKKAEVIPRGYYTGIFGYFDGENLDSAVMIRFIEEHNGEKFFRSGGGITVLSDARNEYEEVIEKIYLPFV